MDEQQPPTDSFVLKLDSAKVLHAIFSSVGDGRKDQLAAVTVNDAGKYTAPIRNLFFNRSRGESMH